jgi:hypothetical protein
MTEKLCMICGKEIKEKQGTFPLREWTINGAILGELIDLRGHKICLENIEKLVIVPNRFRLLEIEKLLKKMKKGMVYASKAKKKDIMEFLESLEDTLMSDPGKA